ncbi:MAG TPA: tetratricopeptide repeat protein [Thermoanaerobaculia bacterium]
MNKRILFSLVIMTLIMMSCGGTATPPPVAAAPSTEDRDVIDPRVGFTATAQPAIEKRFDAAWREVRAGHFAEAQRRLADLRTRNPQYLPAVLAEAVVDLKQGNLVDARTIVQRLEDQSPDYTAARVYDAEIAIAEHRTRAAYDLYRALALRPDAPPIVADRVTDLQARVFEEVFTAAQIAPDDQAILMLRDALTINPGALNARVLLANKLIARHSVEEARQVLEPIVSSPDFDKPEVQAALAEIEVGRGQFQEAIARYDRLARRDPSYSRRLEQIKQDWSAANMPPQYQRAIETDAIDRSDLAVLIYWKLTSVRFDQNLNSPPIAIDIEDTPGREEIVRAIAIGLYDVDPVTRRVSPLRPVNAATLERLAARLLVVRGAPCAMGVPAEAVLAACGVNDRAATPPPESPVPGRMAAAMLDDIDKVLPH